MPTEHSLKIVAIIAVYNEGDIIAEVFDHLAGQGVDTYAIDDGSTDDTATIIRSYEGRGLIGIETRALRADGLFDWSGILMRKEELAQALEADWFIHQDADEFRESPWPNVRLVDAIEQVDRAGFNAINFGVLDFWPLPGQPRGSLVQERLTHFAFGAAHNRVQVRCWKKTPGRVDLASSGGHDVLFPERKVFPLRFPMRHYPLRGEDHARRKVLIERLPRFSPHERQLGWHVQYDRLSNSSDFLQPPDRLEEYEPGRTQMKLTMEDLTTIVAEFDADHARASAAAMRSNDVEAELGVLRERFAEQSGQLDASGKRVEEVRRLLDEALRERDALDQRLGDMASALAQSQNEHWATGERLSALSALEAWHRARLLTVESQLAEVVCRLREVEDQLERLKLEDQERQERLRALAVERDRIWSDLQALLASRAWRWTRVARKVAEQLGLS